MGVVMKFIVHRADFAKALSRVQGVVSRKATLPILLNVLLEAKSDDQLQVTATDLDITIDGHIKARVSEPGRITVNGKSLHEIVKNLPGEEVTLELTEENRLFLRCHNAEFQLLGTSADAYPGLPDAEKIRDMTPVDGEVLRELIERTMFSVSTDDSRPNLRGVYFHSVGESRIRMVSTDGHRLSMGEREAERGVPLPEGEPMIIPRKGLNEFKRLLDDFSREVEYGFLENYLVVRAEEVQLYIRLIDGKFPDYNQVIPKSNEQVVVLDRKPFLASLKRIGILSTDRSNSVRIELKPNLMTLISDNPDLGRAKEDIELEEFEGPEINIAFNARYVRDILSILKAKKIEMVLNESLSPGLFRELDDDAYLFVVMPMRL